MKDIVSAPPDGEATLLEGAMPDLSDSSHSDAPITHSMSECFDKALSAAQDICEASEKHAVPDVAATTKTLPVLELAEQAGKVDIDEQPKFKVLRENIISNLTQTHGTEGHKKKQKIKWLLFDCDNTLVLSETLAFMASFDLVNEVLEYKGIERRYVRHELLVHFMGLPFSGMCRKMAEEFNFEWTAADKSRFEQREEDEVIKLFRENLKPLPGVMQVFLRIMKEKKYNIAVVSSSSHPRIHAALDSANLRMFFLDKYIFSAKSCLKSRTCKPDPAIYLHALAKLGVNAHDCVSIEDSRAGVMSAVRAGVPCMGFLGSFNSRPMQDQLLADFRNDGCSAIMWEWSQFFDTLDALQDL